MADREQDLFSIFTPSGPAHPHPHEQGQLYWAAQVRQEGPLYQMMQLGEGQDQFFLGLQSVRGGVSSVQPYPLGLR